MASARFAKDPRATTWEMSGVLAMTTCCKATLCAEEQIYDRRSLCVRCAQILAVIKFVIQIGCATRSIFLALCPAQRVVAILTNCTAIHEWICTRGNPEPFHVRRKKASPVMKAFHCFFFCCGQALCRQATAPFQKPALLMSMNGSTCSALRLRHGPSHAVFFELQLHGDCMARRCSC